MGIVQKSESESESEKINLELLDLLASPQVKIVIENNSATQPVKETVEWCISVCGDAAYYGDNATQ